MTVGKMECLEPWVVSFLETEHIVDVFNSQDVAGLKLPIMRIVFGVSRQCVGRTRFCPRDFWDGRENQISIGT